MVEYKIPEIVSMIENKEIDIPELQREFVWSSNQVKELAESIYKNYPIGSITLYKLPVDWIKKERYWILDGQQRLLSLTLIMKGRVEAIKEGKMQIINANIKFDPMEGKFELRSPRKGENWVILSEVLRIDTRRELERYLRSKHLNPEEQEKVSTLWSVFRGDYKVLIHELSEDLDLDDLGNIFVRTNFAGTRVRGSDVYSTMIAITQRNLVKELRDFCGKLSIEIDYGILIRTFIAFLTQGRVKLASRVLDQARKLKEELAKYEPQIETVVENVKKCIEEAINILVKEMDIMSSRFLPTENVLPVMAYYINKKKSLSHEDKEGILKWFVLASYFGRYSSGSETRLNEDLSEIEKGGSYIHLIKKLEAHEGNLKDRIKEDISNGRLNKLLLYAILKQENAKDLKTQENLTTNNLEVHHIFPKSFLVGSEYNEILDDVGNITLVTSSTNQSLSSELPEKYLEKIPPEIRNAHLIPSDQNLWKLKNCKEFVETRKKHLKESVERFFKIF